MAFSTKMDLVIDCETTGLNTHKDKLLGVSYCDGKKSAYSNELPETAGANIIAHNAKFDAEVIHSNLGVLLNIGFDTQLAYSLLHIDRPKKLETIVKDLFGVHKKDLIEIYNEVTGKKRKSFPDDYFEVIPEERVAEYACEDASYTFKLFEYCKAKLKDNPALEKWYYDIEIPLCNILIKSEIAGVKLNTEKLKELRTESEIKIKELEQELKWLCDSPNANLNSTKQLQEILYKKLKLPKLKKTKTGFSTDTKTLAKLAPKYSFARKLLRYRELSKLLSSFINPLLEQADDKDLIHAWFNQCGTVTRRMSCQNPNLQQIPAKTEIGKELRKCFVPSPGYKFLIADYSQIELRLLAHFSQEPKLIEAFKNGDDIHTRTAEYISKKLNTEFTRQQGKILNFSIIYGKTAWGFAEDWNVSKEEAEGILKTYFEFYPRVNEWIKEQQTSVIANNGWLKSIAGLPLFVSNTSSNDKWKFEEAKRQAVNYLIQASSQDILKKAVVNVYNKFCEEVYPCLLVHDELVYEVRDNSSVNLVVPIMKDAWKLSVPLEVDYKISDYWEK